jgi:hypothetical protein
MSRHARQSLAEERAALYATSFDPAKLFDDAGLEKLLYVDV